MNIDQSFELEFPSWPDTQIISHAKHAEPLVMQKNKILVFSSVTESDLIGLATDLGINRK